MSLKDKARVNEDNITAVLMVFGVVNILFFNAFLAIFSILLAIYFKIDVLINREYVGELVKKENKHIISVDNEKEL